MPVSLDPAQTRLREQAEELARTTLAPRAADVDRSEQYPWDNVTALRDAGFVGMTLAEEYGGRGLGGLEAVLVIEALATACATTARIAVETNMGAIGAVMAYGRADQKRLAADLVLAGDKPAICITEPDAGSAASEMTTCARRHGDVWVLNGRKHWISGGGVSRLHLIFARAFDEQDRELGIGGFLALRDQAPGLVIGSREPAMGVRGMPETEVLFRDLEVPESMRLDPPQGLARGFNALMSAYNGQRVGAAAVALGIAEGAFRLARGYSLEREQFGRPIAEFQGLQWMLADMATRLEAARALIWKAAAGSGFPDMLEAAQAKLFAAETAEAVTHDALQIFGAAGYSRNRPLERMSRDARMFSIAGGTTQILRTVIAARVLGRRLPQRRDGHVRATAPRNAAE